MSEVFRALSAALEQHPEDEILLRNATRAISGLASSRVRAVPRAQHHAATLASFVPRMRGLLRQENVSEDLAEGAARALANLMHAEAACREKAFAENILQLLEATMRRYLNTVTILRQVVRAVANLALDLDPARYDLIVSTTLPMLIKSMNKHPNDLFLQSDGCCAIANLTAQCASLVEVHGTSAAIQQAYENALPPAAAVNSVPLDAAEGEPEEVQTVAQRPSEKRRRVQ